jgi:hypothetical protein
MKHHYGLHRYATFLQLALTKLVAHKRRLAEGVMPGHPRTKMPITGVGCWGVRIVTNGRMLSPLRGQPKSWLLGFKSQKIWALLME